MKKQTQIDRAIKSLEADISDKERNHAAEVGALRHAIKKLQDQQKARTTKPRGVPAVDTKVS